MKIEQGLATLDVQRQKDHEQFLKKEEEFITEVKSPKGQLQKVTEEQQNKTTHLINATHDANEAGYEELQETIGCL